MYDVISQELIALLNKIDPNESRASKLLREVSGAMSNVAGILCIGKIALQYRTLPGVYHSVGRNVATEYVYSDRIDTKKKPLEMRFSQIEGNAVVRVFVVQGHEWTVDEKESIRSIVKQIFLGVSHAQLKRALQEADMTDMLTGLLNHTGVVRTGSFGAFRDVMNYYAGCYFNLKGFSRINKNIGVKKANEVLKNYGKYLLEFIDTDTEIVARLSGDDFFALVMKERAEDFCRYAGEASYRVENREGRSTKLNLEIRMGVYFAEKTDTIENVLSNAGAALESAKNQKRDFSVYSKEIAEQGVMEKKIMADFPNAMANGDILSYYQPKVNMNTMEICGCEALVRWFHDGKMISPGQFLPVIEKNHAMDQLDFYMLETACYDIRNWLDKGIEPVRVSINYSKQHLADPFLAEHTMEIIERHKIDPKYVEIELTETADFSDNDSMQTFVEKLSKNGVKVSMDDFGTGSSSLNLLLNLDFQVVKVDKSFVDNVGKVSEKAGKDELMIRHMVSMLRELKMEVVAEGVETMEQLHWIRDIGCDVVQGYIFDKPLPHSEFEKRLRSRIYKI